MRIITSILIILFAYSCSTEKHEGKSMIINKNEQQSDDNNSDLLNMVIDVADDLPGYIQCAANVQYCSDCLGLAVYRNVKDSSLVLVLLESVGGMKTKIISMKQLENVPADHEFQSLCETNCDCEFSVIAQIIADSLNQTKTIRAWCPDRKTKSIVPVDAESVDCTDAYNTDYD